MNNPADLQTIETTLKTYKSRAYAKRYGGWQQDYDAACEALVALERVKSPGLQPRLFDEVTTGDNRPIT